jgi:hypothetical protein
MPLLAALTDVDGVEKWFTLGRSGATVPPIRRKSGMGSLSSGGCFGRNSIPTGTRSMLASWSS